MEKKVKRKKNVVSERLRKKGFTVRGWARVHGFNPSTVFQFIYKQGGYKGIRGEIAENIKKALKDEGVWV